MTGSNTLANVARAVGGLDLPTLEALGLSDEMRSTLSDLISRPTGAIPRHRADRLR